MQNSRSRFTTTTTIGPLISAGSALLIVLGSMQPWQRTLSVATNGSEIERGFWCLVLGVVALVFCLGRAFANVPRLYYLAGIFVVAALTLGLSGWFYYDIKNAPSGQFFGFQFEMSEVSSGIYLSLTGAIALLVATLVQTVMPDRGAVPTTNRIERPDPVESREPQTVLSADN